MKSRVIDEFFIQTGTSLVQATSPFTHHFANRMMQDAKCSSMCQELHGKQQAVFVMRALWIHTVSRFGLPSHATLDLPQEFQSDDTSVIETLATRIAELGYNTVIFASHESEPTQVKRLTWQKLLTGLSIFKKYGLKLALSFQNPRNEPTFFSDLEELQSYFDYLFWKQGTLQAIAKIDSTTSEKMRLEIESLEKNAPRPLIYFCAFDLHTTSDLQADLLMQVTSYCQATTILSFIVSDGSFVHPVVKHIGKTWHKSFWGLLPIMMSRSRLQVVEHAIMDAAIEPFSTIGNAALLIDHLHESSHINALIEWTFGQKVWFGHASSRLEERWFMTHHPDLDILEVRPLLRSFCILENFLIRLKKGLLSSEEQDLFEQELKAYMLRIKRTWLSKLHGAFTHALVDLKRQKEGILSLNYPHK